MNDHRIFEFGVIGFFIGVVAATYLAFLDSTGAFMGRLIDWVSLRPLISGWLSFANSSSMWIAFIFVVAVYTIYGALIGYVTKNHEKRKMAVFSAAAAIVIIACAEQTIGSITILPGSQSAAAFNAAIISVVSPVARHSPVPSPIATTSEQYFGDIEARGDLNGDGIDDVAFIITRKDAGKNYYYLTAALASSTKELSLTTATAGANTSTNTAHIAANTAANAALTIGNTAHKGLNLVYTGANVGFPELAIKDGVIDLSYKDRISQKPGHLYYKISPKSGLLGSVATTTSSATLHR